MASEKKNQGIIAFLLLTILTIGFLAFQNYSDYAKLQQAFKDEKVELESELDKILTDYDKAITDKISISKELRKERFKVLQFRDTIKNLQEKNYNLIRIYRKRIRKLENQNKFLFAKVDSLNEANTFLQVENIAVREQLSENKQLASKLFKTNSNLKKDKKTLMSAVKKAQKLEVNNIAVTPMKKRNNGKFTSTSRHKKTEAFKVTLDVLKNDIAQKGERRVYIQILDSNKNIISADGHINLKNGQKMVYSDYFSLDYQNKGASLVSLVEVPKGMIQDDKYLISVFLEGEKVGDRVVEF